MRRPHTRNTWRGYNARQFKIERTTFRRYGSGIVFVNRMSLCTAIAGLMVLAILPLVTAQTAALFSIRVHSQSGAPITGALVAVERGSVFSVQAVTDSAGSADVSGLAPGEYKITITG